MEKKMYHIRNLYFIVKFTCQLYSEIPKIKYKIPINKFKKVRELVWNFPYQKNLFLLNIKIKIDGIKRVCFKTHP